jgi:hypothetical protein
MIHLPTSTLDALLQEGKVQNCNGGEHDRRCMGLFCHNIARRHHMDSLSQWNRFVSSKKDERNSQSGCTAVKNRTRSRSWGAVLHTLIGPLNRTHASKSTCNGLKEDPKDQTRITKTQCICSLLTPSGVSFAPSAEYIESEQWQ